MQDLLTKGIDENGKITQRKNPPTQKTPPRQNPGEEWKVVRLGEVISYEQPNKIFS